MTGRDLGDPRQLFADYLDHYRDVIARKLDGLSDEELRTSRLPSGWTPLQLLKHLVYMERRWFHWGFLADPVDDPWGDHDADHEAWQTGPEDTLPDLLSRLHEGGQRTREVILSNDLASTGAAGGRFTEDDAPTLAWICFHVLQEYARHAGHLDIARELADGTTGE